MRIHEGQPVRRDGAPLATAGAVLILLHGRGSRAEEMIELGRALRLPNVALVAPQAADGEWYPQRFLAPRAQNEPWLASALAVVAGLIDEVGVEARLLEKIVLGGFSQGACLALDFAASHPRRYAAVLGLSGALIGPLDSQSEYRGSLGGTPVLVGCAERDPHIPIEHVRASAKTFRDMGAVVTEQIFPGAAHTVFPEEIAWVRRLAL
jgi:predicted esterase